MTSRTVELLVRPGKSDSDGSTNFVKKANLKGVMIAEYATRTIVKTYHASYRGLFGRMMEVTLFCRSLRSGRCQPSSSPPPFSARSAARAARRLASSGPAMEIRRITICVFLYISPRSNSSLPVLSWPMRPRRKACPLALATFSPSLESWETSVTSFTCSPCRLYVLPTLVTLSRMGSWDQLNFLVAAGVAESLGRAPPGHEGSSSRWRTSSMSSSSIANFLIDAAMDKAGALPSPSSS
mmetsp:Transcript_21096/g.66826  ORF Transcript_21096/g.66826 Transcript_21096/m.66826 type:complete len:239 (-) Transcript_21096:48-764(-)